LLLRLSFRPIHASLLALAVAIAGCVVALRGDYWSIVVGALLLNCFSILDGCDGEIARVTYQQTRFGHWLDFIIDTLANIGFVLCLAIGLATTRGIRFFLFEGIAIAVLILASECLLGGVGKELDRVPANSKLYGRHDEMFSNVGLTTTAAPFITTVTQLTKRDVAWVAFVLLALANLAPWILHLSLAVVGAACVLSLLAVIRRRQA
jgi:phosphatidylglycerophosphate synthase